MLQNLRKPHIGMREYARRGIAILSQLTAIVAEKRREKGSSAEMHNECRRLEKRITTCQSHKFLQAAGESEWEISMFAWSICSCW